MTLKDLIRGRYNSSLEHDNANPAKTANERLKQAQNPSGLAEIATLAIANDSNEINHNHEQRLLEIVAVASEGLGIKPEAILHGLISDEDEKDMLNDSIPLSCLRAHIANWYFSGMPHISGKNQYS